MKKLLIIALVLISINTIAQDIYQINRIQFDNEKAQEASGVIMLNGIKILIQINDVNLTVIIKPETYAKDTNNFGNDMRMWNGTLITEDEIGRVNFTIIYFESLTSFIIDEGNTSTRIDAIKL